MSGTPGQLTRVATVKPYINVSTLSVVGVVTVPPRQYPRDSVLPKSATINPSPTPIPLGNAATPTPGAVATTAPQVETPATLQPRKNKKQPTPTPTPSPS